MPAPPETPSTSAAQAPEPPHKPPPFPPAEFSPLVQRTAKPGDGEWTPFAPGPPAAAAPLLYRAVAHPDAVKPHVYVAIVAIDLARVGVRLVAGTREPLSSTVPPEHRPGLVARSDLADLVAVFNGGFMTRHGAWGMAVGGETLLPAHPDGCTVALLADGSVQIRTHASLPKAEVAAFRQTPPCLVERGVVNPAIASAEKPRAWGLAETGAVDIRRSALGVDEQGGTLFYGSGEWVTPRQLAEAMHAAGAFDVAELDVNWSYTRFLLYQSAPSGPEVAETLVPKTKHAPGQYVKKPAERDFFYLVRRR